MARFCIMSAMKSEMVSGRKRISQCESRVLLVFNAEDLRSTSVKGGKVTFRCDNFAIDEEKSFGNWQNAFDCNAENGMVVIKINPDYKIGVVMPYFV